MAGRHDKILETMPRAIDLVIAGVMFIVGFISLLAAYHLFTSKTWQIEYGLQGNGWWYELGRLVLGVLVTLYLVGTVYQDEATRLFTIRPPRDSSVQLHRARRTILVLGALAIVILLAFHVFQGPYEMRVTDMQVEIRGKPEQGYLFWLSSEADRREFLYPYLSYIGYSVVNMIGILFVICAIGLMGAIKDVRRVCASGCQVLCDDEYFDLNLVKKRLRTHKLDFQNHIRRSSVLLAGLVLVIAYERVYGWETLSDGGKKFAFAAYFVMLLSTSFVFFSHHAYGETYSNVLHDSGDEHDDELEKYNPASVWKQTQTSFPIVMFALGSVTIFVDVVLH